MSPVLTEQNEAVTVDKMSIWDEDSPAPDQTATHADALLTKPDISSQRPGSENDLLTNATEHLQETLSFSVSPLVRLTKKQTPNRLFKILQQWEGIVSEMTEDSVWAELVDLTNRGNAEEYVELPLAEFPEADRDILKPGSVFYWAIGREWSPGGQMRRISEIRVRRIPQWSRHDIETIREKAQNLMDRFGIDANESTASS